MALRFREARGFLWHAIPAYYLRSSACAHYCTRILLLVHTIACDSTLKLIVLHNVHCTCIYKYYYVRSSACAPPFIAQKCILLHVQCTHCFEHYTVCIVPTIARAQHCIALHNVTVSLFVYQKNTKKNR